MESTEEVKIMNREEALNNWLSDVCGLTTVSLQSITGDASFRRYFRVITQKQSFVVMDAPPLKEDCRPYVAVAHALRGMGIKAPEIFHADIAQGFLLITDFGDLTYLKTLNQENADDLYPAALHTLAVLQQCRDVPDRVIPFFTPELMQQEWAWHKEWFLGKLLNLSLTEKEEEGLNACFTLLVDAAKNQPQVFMHRDYHSANLMVLPDNAVGVLDFQDAFIGPVTYDVASLLRDCYIAWPEEQVTKWVTLYWQMLKECNAISATTQAEFIFWFDWMGIERHLKALFTFARKHVRDQQSHYLQHVPRTLHYLLSVSSRYHELQVLHEYYRDQVLPRFELMRAKLCVQ